MSTTIVLWARQSIATGIAGDVGSVKNTFSSWDSCMSKAYCKWPVIIGIVIGSLTLLSVLFCLARCLCCGAECCCACFSCCNACCPSPRQRERSSKNPPPSQYPPPGFQPSPYQGYMPTPAPVYNAQPQFATFDASSKRPVNEDALPPMPSWETAQSRKVLEDPKDDDMEMGRLDPLHEQTAPMLANQAPTPRVGYSEVPGSETMPYQQYGAYHGGDLGNPYENQDQPSRSPQSPYAQAPQSPYGASAGLVGPGAGGRGQTPHSSYAQDTSSPYGAATGPMGGRGQGPPSPYGPPAGVAGAAIGGRGQGNNGYGYQQGGYGRNGAYSQQQPQQQRPGYSGYASSETSTRYEPSSAYGGQESGIVYSSRPAPARQQSGGALAGLGVGAGPSVARKPLQNSWREV